MKELKAIYDGRKSFYGKALVAFRSNGNKILYSYGALVAILKPDGEMLRTWSGYSSTTMRHVNEFRKQNNLPAIGKKDWVALKVHD